jgi:hypothetical protein
MRQSIATEPLRLKNECGIPSTTAKYIAKGYIGRAPAATEKITLSVALSRLTDADAVLAI